MLQGCGIAGRMDKRIGLSEPATASSECPQSFPSEFFEFWIADCSRILNNKGGKNEDRILF